MNPRRWFRKYFDEQVRTAAVTGRDTLYRGRRYRLISILAAACYFSLIGCSVLFSPAAGIPRYAADAIQENWEKGAFVEYWSVSVSDWK